MRHVSGGTRRSTTAVLHWTSEGDATIASEGEVIAETQPGVKPGEEDKWVHSYGERTRLKPWEGEPFMHEGRVDLQTLLNANEPDQYPRRTASTSSIRTQRRGARSKMGRQH